MPEVVLIVQDEPSARARLFRILVTLGYADDEIVCVSDVVQAKDVAGRHSLEMVLADLRMPDRDDVELIAWLRSINKSLPILVVSAWNVEEMVLDAIRAGANGYLLKERDDLEIAVLLKTVANGGAPIDPFITRHILGLANGSTPNRAASKPDIAEEPPGGLLSKRELAILTRVAEGMSNREIAEVLNISQWTVDTHIRHIYGKLKVNSRTQAVRTARRLGLLF